MKLNTCSILILVSLVLGAVLVAQGRNRAYQDPQPTTPAVEDPIEQLRLAPEQRRQIRTIMEQTKDERQMANRRLREANAALDQAIDTLDENLIEQKMSELTAAQAAQTRMRVQTELRVRKVLTPDQQAVLRELKLHIRDVMAPQRPNQRGVAPGRDGLRPNSRNSIAPLERRRP
jgi:Spy/CpxP family protein refolding chaperone